MSFSYVLLGLAGTLFVTWKFGLGPFRLARRLHGMAAWNDVWDTPALVAAARSVIGLATTAVLLAGLRPIYDIILDSAVNWAMTAAIALVTAGTAVLAFRYLVLQTPLPPDGKRTFLTTLAKVSASGSAILVPFAFGQILPLVAGRAVGGAVGGTVFSIAAVYWFLFMAATLFLGSRNAYGADRIDGRLAPLSSVLAGLCMVVVTLVKGPEDNVSWGLFLTIAIVGLASTVALAAWELRRISSATAP